TSVEYDHADLYPDPQTLLAAYRKLIALLPESGRLVACGDAPEVRALARAVRDGTIPLHWGADAEEAHAALVALPGVGDWTADYIAMRALGLPDSFPAGDLGVRKAMANGHDRLPPVRDVIARAEAWRPWRAYAVLHLWMSAGDAPPRKRPASPSQPEAQAKRKETKR
ncbi:hypothetical protein K8I85_14215, partial [bacterium]|nr:hypothetical protein [bacterium]